MKNLKRNLTEGSKKEIETHKKTVTKIFQKAKYSIDVVGLAADAVITVVIDDTIALIQRHPTYTLRLCPFGGCKQPTFEKVLFYANCMSFEADLPTFVAPLKTDFLRHNYRPIEYHFSRRLLFDTKVQREELKHKLKTLSFSSFMSSHRQMYESINDIRKGLCIIRFLNSNFDNQTHLNYTEKYTAVAQELGLYSMALRQADFLSEFLCYYRVLESTTKDNAKSWISESLGKLPNHNFGEIVIEDVEQPLRMNLLSLYRRLALKRMRLLRSKFQSNQNIADYLYSETRCGVAHGKSNIKMIDYSHDYFNIAKDNYIMKLLARMAIMEKLPKS